MITTHFHGGLGMKYGKTHMFQAPTAFLVMQGIGLQLGDKFREEIKAGEWAVVIGKPAKDKSNSIEDYEVHNKLGDATEIHIFPVVKGKSGWVRIIIGVVLIVVGALTSWAGG
jgi:predicted phage tail protein